MAALVMKNGFKTEHSNVDMNDAVRLQHGNIRTLETTSSTLHVMLSRLLRNIDRCLALIQIVSYSLA